MDGIVMAMVVAENATTTMDNRMTHTISISEA
jgi:hypothetical protein